MVLIMAAHEARRLSSMIQVRLLTIVLLQWRPVAIIRHILPRNYAYLSAFAASTVATTDHSRRWLIFILVIDTVGQGRPMLLVLSFSNLLSSAPLLRRVI